MSTDGAAGRADLVRQLLARAGGTAAVEEPVQPPNRPEERRLITIWEEVLEREAIGADDDYFALGGDSIAAVAVVSRARAAGFLLTTQDLFELRTVRAIITALDLPTASRRSEMPAGGGLGARRTVLTPLQRGILYQSLADPSGTTQLVQVTATLTGDIDVQQFSAACRTLARRHDALRTAIGWDASGAWMAVNDDALLPIHVVDLRKVPAIDQPAAVADELRRDLAIGMDLRTPPLARIMLLRLGEDVVRFALTHHHLVLDGWSQQIVLRELLDLYDGVDPAALPTPHNGLVDHRAWLDRLDHAAGAARWRELLKGFRPAPVAGRPADPATVPGAVTVAGPITDLSADAQHLKVTPATLVYAAWSVVVAQLTGSDDVTVGVTVSGRPAMLPRAPSAVGMFIATLPLRLQMAPDDGLPAWLHRVHSARWELEDLQHCALTDIARAACGERVAEPAGLFETIVVIENFPELVAEGTSSRRLVVSSVTGSVWEGYPLVLEARFGSPGGLLLRGDASVISQQRLRSVYAAVHAVLGAMGTAGTVADLRSIAVRYLARDEAPTRKPRESRRQVVSGLPAGDWAGSPP